jgi:hypothetical protein
MNSVAGFIVLMVALSGSPPPQNPEFKEITIICKSIKYLYQIDGYPYIGINIEGNKNYLTNYTEYAIISDKIDKECNK